MREYNTQVGMYSHINFLISAGYVWRSADLILGGMQVLLKLYLYIAIIVATQG